MADTADDIVKRLCDSGVVGKIEVGWREHADGSFPKFTSLIVHDHFSGPIISLGDSLVEALRNGERSIERGMRRHRG